MNKETEFSEDSPEPGQKVFVFVNFSSNCNVEVEKLKSKVTHLGGGGEVVENSVTWDARITHVISKNFVKSEIVLAGKFLS